MDKIEIFQILEIEEIGDERALKEAYRKKLAVTNPEDNPEGFKRLRSAYEEACRLARQPEETDSEPEDETPSGIWVKKAAQIYGNIRSRQDVEQWKALFEDDCFLSLEDEENCRVKLLRFLTEHYRLPGEVWKLLDKKLSLTSDAAKLREQFPADFIHYILTKCERGEDVEFWQFEGAEDAPYDLFLQYYDRCWQALQKNHYEQAEENIRNADALGIRHPVMEICRAELLSGQGKVEEALAVLEGQRLKYPKDAMLEYNTAETLWRQKDEGNGSYRLRSAEIYRALREENDNHYMANLRLAEWYYDNGRFQEAKKCAEKVLAVGGNEEFTELLGKLNREIEKDLEEEWRKSRDCKAALELCWCYLQDGKICQGINLALKLEKILPPEREAEWNGLMAKLYVEEAEYETSVSMTYLWEQSLEKKLLNDKSEEDREKDRDRLKQARMIRMQCNYNLGFRDKDKFAEAIREGEAILEGNAKDIGVLMEMAQIYTEMQEYEKCEDIVHTLVEDYQIYAAYAVSLEAYKRQLNAGGVIRAGSICIQYFPTFVKAYEYMAKVYLDLGYGEELEKVFADAEKNGVHSDILEAYQYQLNHFRENSTTNIGDSKQCCQPMGQDILNNSLRVFRKEYRKPVEEGKLAFYEAGLPKITVYLNNCPDSYMFVERGIFHRAAHHYEEAKADFEKALSLNPSNPYALNGLSFLYKYLGDYEKALFYIKRAILYMDEDMSPVIYTDMADLYSLLGCYDMALATCRQYEEMTHDKSIWFLNQLAEVYVNLGKAEEACALYEQREGKDKWSCFEDSVDACLKCGNAQLAEEKLQNWADELGIKRGGIRNLLPIRMNNSGSREYIRFYWEAVWVRLVFGERQGVLEYLNRMRKYTDLQESAESKLSDAVFACIVCGFNQEGKRFATELTRWLQREKFSENNKYYNHEKAYLQMEILSSWYTKEDEKLQEILDRENECEICHTCTSVVCREMEGVRILFLLRQGKVEEARKRLNRNLEIQPGDEYMLAIRHMLLPAEEAL